MPSRPIPTSFWLLLVFGALGAGIIALAGFAIDKGSNRDARPAVEAANMAAAELIQDGLFEAGEGDPALKFLSEDTADLSEDTAEGESSDKESQSASTREPNPSYGQELFFANGCNICHGDNGQGGVGPTIASTGLALEQVVNQYRNPRGMMPEFRVEQVSETAIADIYAWLKTLPLPDEVVPGLGTP